MMPLGRFALEDIFRAAVRAYGFTRFQYVEKNTRMAAPQRSIGLRAVQRQVVGGDFYGHVVGHVLFSLSLDVGQPVVVLGGTAITDVEILGLDLGG